MGVERSSSEMSVAATSGAVTDGDPPLTPSPGKLRSRAKGTCALG